MGHNSSADEQLPATWPFRAAGTCLLLAMTWFCLGYGVHDATGGTEHLPSHMPIFLSLLALGTAFTVGGAIYNVALERGRQRNG